MLLEIEKKIRTRPRGHPLSSLNLSPNSHFSLGERLSGSPAFGSRISSLRTAFCLSASASRASSPSLSARSDSSSALSPSVKRPPPRWGAPSAPGVGILARASALLQAPGVPGRSPSILATSLAGFPWARSLRASLLVPSGYLACFSWAQAPGTRGLSHSISPLSQALSHFLSVSLFGPP